MVWVGSLTAVLWWGYFDFEGGGQDVCCSLKSEANGPIELKLKGAGCDEVFL